MALAGWRFVIAGAAALAATLLVARSCETAAPAPPAPDAGRGEPSTTVSASMPTETASADRSASPAAAPVSIEPWLAHPYEFELEVRVVDPTGWPREGVEPHLAPRDVVLDYAQVRTGVDGRCVVRWRSRRPTGDVVLCDDHGVLHVVSLHDGHRPTWTTTGTSSSIGDSDAMRSGLHPFAAFADHALVVPLLTGEQPLRVGDSVLGHLSIAPWVRPTLVRALEITVVAENGHPAAREFVQVFVPGSKPVATGTTDDAGRFVLENPAEGTFAVRAGGDAAGLGTATAVVANGIARVRVDLQRGACVRGRVVRDDSNATSPYRIVWRAEDGSWCDETTTANDGSFVLANLPAIPGDVCAWQDERALALPVAFARHVLTDNGELLLRHDAAHEHRIVLEPVLPDECPDVAIELRVWNVDSGLGAFVPPPKGGSQWTIAGLVPGWYRIEVRAAGCGFVDLGQHWVDGANDIDLGRIVLPRPGRARFVVPEGRAPVDEKARALEIYAVRADLDVRVKPDRDPPWGVDEVPFDRPVFLPAGNYVFAFRHRDGGVRLVRFTCRAGEETLVLAPE